MHNEFNFCPICGSKNIHYKIKKWFCDDCGFDLYNNVASAVGIIICDKNNNVLFEERAKNPRKGFLALPGGFCDRDESIEEALVRECREEIGFTPTDFKYLTSFPNDYTYKDIHYKTCDIFFECTISENMRDFVSSLKSQESEVTSFKILNLSSLEDIEDAPIAFNSGTLALKYWLQKII